MTDSTVMDLDMSLDQRISAQRASARGRRGNNNAQAATGRVVSNSINRKSNRPSPYSRESSAPDGKWGHSGFVEQNHIKGGALAARLQSSRPPGGFRDDDERGDAGAVGQWAHDRYSGGGRGDQRRPGGALSQSHLARKTLAALTGETSGGRGRSKVASSGPISVKGASATTVEVRNLVPGTTAEDVAAIFGDPDSATPTVLSAKEVDLNNKSSVTVQVKFANYQLAADARQKFNNQQADGRTLEVVILESPLRRRLPSFVVHSQLASRRPRVQNSISCQTPGVALVACDRSDALLGDARAQVQTAPPVITAANPRGLHPSDR
ncbi:hypothetical protein BS47DRAFT_1393041 [Hydnum rufescens UP504]|uniref:RRM domain-containing protein n=1 Tax=Hydnum rufescens UP504 TaxID=1448309 RepID=A0A9P6AYR8_9AGAM|nr:hypothetical protein BS47DRAFT_1393041 [Hydnum rufescens UP504]